MDILSSNDHIRGSGEVFENDIGELPNHIADPSSESCKAVVNGHNGLLLHSSSGNENASGFATPKDKPKQNISEKHGSSKDKHSSSSKDKHNSSSSSYKDKQKDNSSYKEKHISSSSSSSSKDKHSSSSSSKDKHSGSSNSKEKYSSTSLSNSSKNKHVSSSSKDKHASSSTSGSKDKHSSFKEKTDKHRNSKDHSNSEAKKDKSSSDMPADKYVSSSKHVSDKHSSSSKEKSSSSDDKHVSSSKHSSGKHLSSSKEKSISSDDKHISSSKHSSDKHSSCSKEKSTSSSSKHSGSSKYSSSSSSYSKERSSDKHSKSSDVSLKGLSHNSKSSSKVKESSSSSKITGKEQDKHSESLNKHKDKHKHSLDSDFKAKQESSSISKKEFTPDLSLGESKTDLYIKKEKDVSINSTSISIKEEMESDDDVPLSSRQQNLASKVKGEKRKSDWNEDDDDDVPLAARSKKRKSTEPSKKFKEESDYEDEFVAKKKKLGKSKPSHKREKSDSLESKSSPSKKVKKDEPDTVWKWWEEGSSHDGGVKWKTLEHKGPLFAPPYERLPKSIHFKYDGKSMELSEAAEEVAGFYARFIEHDYCTKEAFNKNFFKDWRKVMNAEERKIITDLNKCNFREIFQYYQMKSEEKKALPKEEKKKLKLQNEAIQEEYGYCVVDGYRQKIGNFRIEPPGLFRGRGDHPKMGSLKRRIEPEDVAVNCSKGSKIPKPPEGHRWKEVKHDNTVTWLATWIENVQGQNKYVMLNPSSKLKGEKDYQKYELARKLKNYVENIRATYREDWKSKEMKARQRSVALYFIDKLALRAGNEKEEGESADTVGCCSLRVEHITLHEEKDEQEYVVEFDFLGKDSIRYTNSVPVEKRVFKNLVRFMENKKPGDDLFDRLNTTILNKYLQELMEGLTAKVFRTYNASKTLQDQLDLLSQDCDDSVPAKILAYNRANRAVAILCNHQRAVPKMFGQQMERLNEKIKDKKEVIKKAKKEMKNAKADYKSTGSDSAGRLYERKKKALQRLEQQLVKLEVQATDKEENKEIALGTSKLNYLDPRISVAWCKKYEVPIEKIYNKTQREKFRWAIDMTEPDFFF